MGPPPPGIDISVDVLSDTVCPWCYIGKRRLEKAMSQFPGTKFLVRWHPFQLNPQACTKGQSKLEFYESKFGKERTQQMIPFMTEIFHSEGIENSFTGLTGNTFNSHRLIALAGRQGPECQDSVVEGLFRGYFCEGKFINDPSLLLEVAQKAGLKDAQKAVDDPDEGREQVLQEIDCCKKKCFGVKGVTGVPHFVINGKYHLSGAQETSTLTQIFAKLSQEA